MESKTSEELAEISKAYWDHKDEIEEAILADLHRCLPQTSIAASYGMTQFQVHSRAKKAGITYYSKDSQGAPRAASKKIQHARQSRLCAECKLAWEIQDMGWKDEVLVCFDCLEKL